MALCMEWTYDIRKSVKIYRSYIDVSLYDEKSLKFVYDEGVMHRKSTFRVHDCTKKKGLSTK